jgi:hypothetical protein
VSLVGAGGAQQVGDCRFVEANRVWELSRVPSLLTGTWDHDAHHWLDATAHHDDHGATPTTEHHGEDEHGGTPTTGHDDDGGH